MKKNAYQRFTGSAILAVGFAIPLVVLGLWLIRLFPYHPGIVAIAGWIIVVPASQTASSLQGFSFSIAWTLGILAEAISIFAVLQIWTLVRSTRDVDLFSPVRRTASLGVLLLTNLLLGFVLVGYLEEMQPPLAVPVRLVPGEFKAAKAKLPRGMTVDFDALAFARGRLYVSSGIGLIEIEGTKVSAIYRWHIQSRIDGVWSGPKGQSLWLQQTVSNDLSTLDDSGWRNVALPTPERGYTRGDILDGIRIAPNQSDVWLSGGSTLWKWRADKSLWEAVQLPEMSSTFESVEVQATSQQPMILRGANQMFGSGKGAVLLKGIADGKWAETQLDECCVKDLSTIGDQAYFRNKGALVRIADGRSETIPSPGRVEAISSDGGRLIVSITDQGIFSFTNEWKKLFDAPYPLGLEESWVHLAAHDGVIALSVMQPSSSTAKLRGDGLWVSNGPNLVKVEVPD